MKKERTEAEKLQEDIGFEFKNIAFERPEDIKPAMEFAEGYKSFMNSAKTERECVEVIAGMAQDHGYKAFDSSKKYQAGDKIYFANKKKAITLITLGKEELSRGARFNVAHIDCPRLDLKPFPLYEDTEISYLKTHYYGGIRKYQWGVIPLSMHGTVITRSGHELKLSIGEKDDEPKFYISDLLPHLAMEQSKRPLSQGLKGEELNIIIGSLPYPDKEVKDKFKLMTLKILSDKYGMTEEDFLRAEIEMVPAYKACDIGLDRSLVAAYGQDDRVCAYPALMSALDITDPQKTTVTVFTDKEEIGSEGNTGMNSRFLDDLLEDLCETAGTKLRDLYRNSVCLSSDVNSVFDPTFQDVFEKQNASILGHGPAIMKYTGHGGKAGGSEASAETMAELIDCMERENVIWQIGELGKVDIGGGGTIAMYMADRDVDTVDIGVPVMAMHSPFELSSKLDIYHTYKAYRAFYR